MTDNTADTDANTGPGTERPPPDDRERRRDSETGDQSADGSRAPRCATADSGGKAVGEGSRDSDGESSVDATPDTDADSDADSDADADTDADSDRDGDHPDSTERYLHWLKLWRVVLLVLLAIVRLIRAL